MSVLLTFFKLGSINSDYLTIIPRARVGYEMIERNKEARGASLLYSSPKKRK